MVKMSKIMVAAYCRSSGYNNEEKTSLIDQIEYYTNMIQSNPAWQLVGVFSDADKSGKKPNFHKMLRKAMVGDIDLILCQSISRFGSNMMETINTIRYLSEQGIQIIFEKEGIDTNNQQSKAVLSKFYAIAEEGSKNLSDSARWVMAKKFEKGEPVFFRMLGYRLEGKKWSIVPEEAEIVKEAFTMYLDGKTPLQIARLFIQKGYLKSNGRNDWSAVAVKDILKNERYTSDVLCRKSQEQKRRKKKDDKNHENDKDTILIKNHHDAIISHEVYQQAKSMLEQGNAGENAGMRKSYPLSRRLKCNECGSNFQRFVCRGKVTWRCPSRTKSKKLCSMTGIREELIVKAANKAFDDFYELFGNGDSLDMLLIKLKDDMASIGAADEKGLKMLRMELEDILLAENKVMLLGDKVKENSAEVEILRKQREEKEKQIMKLEARLHILEEDSGFRKAAVKLLEELQNTKEPLEELRSHMNEMSFLRAWVVDIIVLTPLSFVIKWNSGESSIVEMAEGDTCE